MTLAEIIKQEARELSDRTGKLPYFSKPYPCAIDECLGYFKNFGTPIPGNISIEKEQESTTINLKPRKGSGKRKLYSIKIWVA